MMTMKDRIAAAAAVAVLCLGFAYAYSTWPLEERHRCERIGGSFDLMGDCVR